MNEPSTIGRWIKQQRAELDLTQEALADRVGCAAQTIRTIESGRRRPSREMAERLAQTLLIPEEEQAAFLRMARGIVDAPPDTAEVVASTDVAPAPSTPVEVVPTVERRSTLPLSPNVFIGREHEQSDFQSYFADPSCRLLTVVGTGGVGKSRLALEVANAVSTRFTDGVVWVTLATVGTADRVAAAVAEALGQSLGTHVTETQLLSDLRPKQMLLVLDGFEHLLDATSFVAMMLQEAPHVSLLVTSRERLRIQGEWVVELDGLPLPREGASNIQQSPAVRLFIERARQMQRDFAVTPSNEAAIVRICTLLQGMPLGIELAAAWVRTLSCDEIADEIAGSLDFLIYADRDAPARHRSLRAVFEHSWRLLGDAERDVLARLAVFHGACRREAARDVAGGTLPLLASLVDKSLVRRVVDATGTPRYDLHELVRAYAGAKLAEDTVTYRATRDQHRAFYAALLAQLTTHKPGATVAVGTQHDYDNIRHAWEWAVENGDAATLLTMSRDMTRLYEDNGWYADGARIFDAAAAALQSSPAAHAATHAAASHLRAEYGYFLGRSGQFTRAREVLERCLTSLGAADTTQTYANVQTYLGFLCYQLGDYDAALMHLQDARVRAPALGDLNLVALNGWVLGLVYHAQGHYDEGCIAAESSIATWRADGRERGPALGMYVLSLIAVAQQRWDDAQATLRESLRIASAAHDRWTVGRALAQLGAIAVVQGDAAEARYLLRESIEVFTELDERWSLAVALKELGSAEAALDRPAQARQTFGQSLAIARDHSLLPVALDALFGVARLKADAGAADEAAVLLCAVVAHPATLHHTREHARAFLQSYAYDVAPADQPTLEALIDRVLRDDALDARSTLAA
jgi:predicted ATPase/transcriptional regulator with XRE-family HTH domain